VPALRILLVDDHALVRAGMRSLLASFPDFEVVGETDDGAKAVDMAGKLQPNLILMDIAMHGLNGLDATARIRNQFPDVRVVILSMHSNEEYVFQALRAGASGYLLKDSVTPRQREILQLVAEGSSTKEIAHRLTLSVKTIEAHRSQIMERLGIRDIPGLVRFAVRAGLISADR